MKARPAIDLASTWTHRFLFDWNPGEDDVLSNLILSLKSSGSESAWDHWADRFLGVHAESLSRLDGLSFVVAPSLNARDHSVYFAEALSRMLGRPIAGRPLEKGSVTENRGLTKRQRMLRTDLVKNTAFRRPRGRKIVLIDDVLTTGATARAVQHALGGSRGFEVWTLATRGASSCGAPSRMIGN